MERIHTFDTDIENQVDKNQKKPRRALIFSAFIALLIFLHAFFNSVCTFLLKLITDTDFMTQFRELVTDFLSHNNSRVYKD